MGLVKNDFLVIKKRWDNSLSNEDAVYVYQSARSRAQHLSLIGSGVEGAVCLMLACRFMPDEIHIFPLLGCGIDTFVKEVSSRVAFPYFICAPLKIYVSHSVTDYERAHLKRLLRNISSFQKEIVYVENEQETYLSLTNPNKTTKTLA